MDIPTQLSFSGFIATDPKLDYASNGDPRFTARVGHENFERQPDGSFKQLETSYHYLTSYRATATHAFEMLRRGDKFVAQGYVRDYSYEVEGQPRNGQEFIFTRFGHDAGRHDYTIDRRPAADRAATRNARRQQAVENSTPQAPVGQEPALADIQPAGTAESAPKRGAFARAPRLP